MMRQRRCFTRRSPTTRRQHPCRSGPKPGVPVGVVWSAGTSMALPTGATSRRTPCQLQQHMPAPRYRCIAGKLSRPSPKQKRPPPLGLGPVSVAAWGNAHVGWGRVAGAGCCRASGARWRWARPPPALGAGSGSPAQPDRPGVLVGLGGEAVEVAAEVRLDLTVVREGDLTSWSPSSLPCRGRRRRGRWRRRWPWSGRPGDRLVVVVPPVAAAMPVPRWRRCRLPRR